MSKPKLLKRHRMFDGFTEFYEHASTVTHTPMRFAVFTPPQALLRRVPVLYFLSGLTCTEENFIIKAGAQRYASEHGLMLVVPDTSPRGTGIKGEDESFDLGSGAGFYVDATEPNWSRHYRMYTYVRDELPAVIHAHFPALAAQQSIMGHSMGGHGALILALKNPSLYTSVSAFAPICAPTQSPWGQKAFTAYLGDHPEAWREYDAAYLVSKAKHRQPILIDQGSDDEFLKDQLKPEILQKACSEVDYPLDLRMRTGYDHSYYFVATFIGEHIAYHAKALGRQDASN